MVSGREKFGAFVRREREAKEIGLREMAKMIGVSPTYLSKVERDEFAPPAEDKVKAIAKIIGCDADELLARAGRVSHRHLGHHQAPPGGTGGAAADHEGLDGRGHRPAGPASAEGEGQVTRLNATVSTMQMRIDDHDAEESCLTSTRSRSKRDAAGAAGRIRAGAGCKGRRPIPIEDIIEKHLKLGIEFDDMHRLFGVPRSGFGFDPDILGAIFFDERRIVIDESLDPEREPVEGRPLSLHAGARGRRTGGCTVTCSPRTRRRFHLFNEPAPPSVVCRSSQAKAPVEWQADFYASCLLMPRKLVIAAWDEAFPDRKPRVLQPADADRPPFVEIDARDRLSRRSESAEATIRRSRVSPSPSPRSSSFRRSPCASGWKSSGCCIARSRINAASADGA